MRFGIVHHSVGHGVPVEEAMRIAYEYGAQVFATGASSGNRELLAELSERYTMEIVAGWGDKFIENGENQPTKGFEQFCREVCRPLDIRVLSTCSSHHRWRDDPPLEEQLTRLSAALKRLCSVAADCGVFFAIENHADYRADDILSILERVDSPYLRVQLDTGNCYAVAEEPVDAALKLAPYAISTHIKDMTIRPLTEGEWVKVKGCAIGDGNVDLLKIARILAEHAPSNLPFDLEVEPPPGTDMKVALERSVCYVEKHLSDFVTFRHS